MAAVKVIESAVTKVSQPDFYARKNIKSLIAANNNNANEINFLNAAVGFYYQLWGTYTKPKASGSTVNITDLDFVKLLTEHQTLKGAKSIVITDTLNKSSAGSFLNVNHLLTVTCKDGNWNNVFLTYYTNDPIVRWSLKTGVGMGGLYESVFNTTQMTSDYTQISPEGSRSIATYGSLVGGDLKTFRGIEHFQIQGSNYAEDPAYMLTPVIFYVYAAF